MSTNVVAIHPIIINGFAPCTDRTTLVQLFGSSDPEENPRVVALGAPDENGLIRFDLDEALVQTVITVAAIAPGQKLESKCFVLCRDGVFITLVPRANDSYRGEAPPFALPMGWVPDSMATMERLRSETTFPALSLRQLCRGNRVCCFQNFTALWNAFSKWYSQAYVVTMTDRKGLDALKIGSDTTAQKLLAAMAALAEPSPLASLNPYGDFAFKAYRKYMLRTPFTHFVQLIYANRVTRDALSIGKEGDTFFGETQLLGDLALVAHLADETYHQLYSKMRDAQFLAAGKLEDDNISVENALAFLGIGMIGNVVLATGNAPVPTRSHPVAIQAIENECQHVEVLARLLRAKSKDLGTSVSNGCLELLFLVRNHILSGDLSPDDSDDYNLVEASYNVLDSLVFQVSRSGLNYIDKIDTGV